MPTYQKADGAILAELSAVMRKYHGRLADAGVTVDVLMAYASRDENGDPIGHAIKHRGVVAKACIRIIGLKDRAAGRADAEMLIDGDEVDTWSEEELWALLDHELTHLELLVDREGNIKRDDLERPRLKLRPHDREFGWFDDVARRHRAYSFESQQAREMFEDYSFRQLYLPGMDMATKSA